MAEHASSSAEGSSAACDGTGRIILIGDLHVHRLWVPPWSLLSKRLLGQANVWLNRRHHFDRTLLAPLVQRIAAVQRDMLLFSGDLTSTALRAEFEDVFTALKPITAQQPTLVIPGNHDRYTFSAARRRTLEKIGGSLVPDCFPYFRRLEAPAQRWSLLALDAAVPRTISSRGRAGANQLEQARHHIDRLTSSDGLVVLCHYALHRPPGQPEMKPSHRLADADAVESLLAACPGPVLFLHGHVHQPWCWRRGEAGLKHILDVNAGAPCLRDTAHPHGQGFLQIDLPSDPHEPVGLLRHVLRSAKQSGASDIQWHTEQVQ
jgi:3',5'-cyclic AMP phosphodiesterase CpdA